MSGHASPSGRAPLVAIDGPAGSGKSTTAREVAHRLGFRHLDSGALYRALTWALLESGIPEEEWDGLETDQLDRIPLTLERTGSGFHPHLGGESIPDEVLRTERVTSRVSQLASLPVARARLLDLQRSAGRGGGVVADGRDMGTVVFPDAEVKVFLTADPDERARRRLLQSGAEDPDAGDVAREIRKLEARDTRDSEREVSPLRVPEDAAVLDTTVLTFEEQVEAVVRLVRGLTL